MKKVYGLVLLCLLSGVALGADDLVKEGESHPKYFRSQDGTVTTIHEAITVLDGLVIKCEKKVDVLLMHLIDS